TTQDPKRGQDRQEYKGVHREPLARIIHDGSSRPPLAFRPSKGYPAVALRDGRAEARRTEACLKQHVEGLSAEPAHLHAAEAACRLVVAANPRLQQKRS